jgi:alpha-1,2-mannosyltransferase
VIRLSTLQDRALERAQLPARWVTIGSLILWPAVLLGFSLKDYVLPRDGQRAPHIDLEVYRVAAASFLNGETLYDRTWIIPPLDRGLPFTYPPFAALALSPTTWLSVAAVGVVWSVLTYLLLSGVLYGFARSMGERRPTAALCAVVGLGVGVCFNAMNSHLSNGQINLVLVALVAADVLVKHPRWPRGVLVGVAAAIKLTPAGFMLLFILRSDWRAVAWAAGSFLTCTLLGAIVAWDDSVSFWTSIASRSEEVRVFDEPNASIHGVLSHMPLGPLARPVAVVAVLGVLAVGAVAITRQLRDGEIAGALLANAVVILLISPVSWSHHWVWIIPAALVLTLWGLRGSQVDAVAAVLTVAVFINGGHWFVYVAWGLTFLALCCYQPDDDENAPPSEAGGGHRRRCARAVRRDGPGREAGHGLAH